MALPFPTPYFFFFLPLRPFLLPFPLSFFLSPPASFQLFVVDGSLFPPLRFSVRSFLPSRCLGFALAFFFVLFIFVSFHRFVLPFLHSFFFPLTFNPVVVVPPHATVVRFIRFTDSDF